MSRFQNHDILVPFPTSNIIYNCLDAMGKHMVISNMIVLCMYKQYVLKK